MNSGDYHYIRRAGDWPHWCYDLTALAGPMAEVSRAQGLLLGRLADVGMALRDQASLAALSPGLSATFGSTSTTGTAPTLASAISPQQSPAITEQPGGFTHRAEPHHVVRSGGRPASAVG